MAKKNLAKLVKKVITNKAGHRQTVWVKSGQRAKAKAKAKAKSKYPELYSVAKPKDLVRTHLVGNLNNVDDSDYASLVSILGKPHIVRETKDGRGQVEWNIKFKDRNSTVASIYSMPMWGTDKERLSFGDWHIGGHRKDALEMVEELLDGTLKEEHKERQAVNRKLSKIKRGTKFTVSNQFPSMTGRDKDEYEVIAQGKPNLEADPPYVKVKRVDNGRTTFVSYDYEYGTHPAHRKRQWQF